MVTAIDKTLPVDYDPMVEPGPAPSVYRLQSDRPLAEEELDRLFPGREEVVAADWLAYPSYGPAPAGGAREEAPFILSPGLFYTSAGEMAASAMEMSAIAAKNVANVAWRHWTEQNGGDGGTGTKQGGRTEL